MRGHFLANTTDEDIRHNLNLTIKHIQGTSDTSLGVNVLNTLWPWLLWILLYSTFSFSGCWRWDSPELMMDLVGPVGIWAYTNRPGCFTISGTLLPTATQRNCIEFPHGGEDGTRHGFPSWISCSGRTEGANILSTKRLDTNRRSGKKPQRLGESEFVEAIQLH